MPQDDPQNRKAEALYLKSEHDQHHRNGLEAEEPKVLWKAEVSLKCAAEALRVHSE